MRHQPMEATRDVWTRVDAIRDLFTELSNAVWETPELNYAEYQSAAAHEALLRRLGFRVETGVAGLPTAMTGEAGAGGPVIAMLGEYDALPGLSQRAGVNERAPIHEGGCGHGCGHNLLGAGSMHAAAAVKSYLEAHGLPGRIRYYGCPAEEGGAGKGFMVRAGLFDDVDAAICWHPAAFSGVAHPVSLACNEINYHFSGVAAHASAAPHLGRSALDAVELMNVGVNYMREHMPASARIHYAVTDPGGTAPNVVQARATVRYLVRAADLDALRALRAWVDDIARGAALMTQTTVRSRILSGDANLVANTPLEDLMHAQFMALGPPAFDAADHAWAATFQATVGEDAIASAFRRVGLEVRKGLALCDVIAPLRVGDGAQLASTDVGSVSWVTPTVQARGATYAIGTPGHSWQLVAQGKSGLAHKGMVHTAKIMASTAIHLYLDPRILERAQAEHRERVGDAPFQNPIPDDVQPPFPDAR
jgi:aminobenzoyl-glutamate utilization protein B